MALIRTTLDYERSARRRRDHRGGVRKHGSEARDFREARCRRAAAAPSSPPTLRRWISRRSPTATSRPQDVIGMHFFSPANVMPLLEVVRTARTSPAAIKTVMELAKPLRKTPVLARVCYGFIGNRMMEGYAREAQRMVLEGATPRAGRHRARRLGHGDGNSRRVRHGRHRRRRERAPGQRVAVSAGPYVLPGRLRAARGRTTRAEERQGLLPLRAGQSHAHRRPRGHRHPAAPRARAAGSAARAHRSRKSRNAACSRC